MPTISVDKADLFEALGRTYTTEEFDELCFDFGIELDEDTTDECTGDERPQLKIEIPANRYDMLCFEGIARALNIFLGREKLPQYKVVLPEDPYVIKADPSTEGVRQYVAGAVLRNLKFDQRRYDSFISLQDKLHSNLCRNRSLVAIGTHDLDKMTGKIIRYRGLKPEDIKFAPLNKPDVLDGNQIMELYEKDKNLSKFLPLIRDSPVYPVFHDEADQVLSLPPIINSDHTKITLDTKNVFIDLTATDRTKLDIVVNQLVAAFSQYTVEPFTVEQVRIESPHNGQSRVCPDLTPRSTTAEVSYINSCLGLNLDGKEISKLLTRMSLEAAPSASDANVIDVKVPISRSDILHECDIMEDAAIGYGFNNLKRTFPADSFTIAKPLPVNKLSDIIRKEAAMATWSEVLTLTLCSHDENYKFLRKKDDGKAVHLANPKTLEYQVVRTSMLPGLLKTIRENRKHPLPLKVFETGDVVFKDTSLERQSYNARHFAAVYAGKTSGFEIVHGLLDRLMKMLRVPAVNEEAQRGYWIAENKQDGTPYFPGRGADVYFREAPNKAPIVIGTMGVLHPEVLAHFEIPYVASSLELKLDHFVI
uniref:Phenylalanine--tRNA ligase beta subunit n=1 Tax=Blastobotrys adeninivorans TaxID=409370 RepID=A0A060T2S1_BLAAD